MDRSRRGSPPSNLIPFRIPARTEDPSPLPPASNGVVVKFRRVAVAPTPKPNLWRIAADAWAAETGGEV